MLDFLLYDQSGTIFIISGMLTITVETFDYTCACGVLVVRLCTLPAHLCSTAVVLVVSKLFAFETPKRGSDILLNSTSLKSNLQGGRWSRPVESENGSVNSDHFSVSLMVTIRASLTLCF